MSGCETRERWLAFTSIASASIRLAMKRCSPGLIVRSSSRPHKAWLRPPCGLFRPAGQHGLVERLLHSVEHFRPLLWQVAREVA